MEYTDVIRQSMVGPYGEFAITISVAASVGLPDIDSPAIWKASHDAADAITAEVMAAILARDPEAKIRAKEEREKLLTLFPCVIFAETIPNEYCASWCCRHLPWFVVTTPIGRFKVGWRKSVIHLEWTETTVKQSADELFTGENVTKFDHTIHCWSYEKAAEYVRVVMAALKEGV